MLSAWTRASHPSTRGVKCVLLDDAGRALFVRHTYGERACWEIPGGGVRDGEPFVDAARREAFEELGADVADWHEVAVLRGGWYGKEEQLAIFAAPWPGGAVRRDPVEIAEVRWFALDAPPAPLGRTTVAALRELAGCPTPVPLQPSAGAG